MNFHRNESRIIIYYQDERERERERERDGFVTHKKRAYQNVIRERKKWVGFRGDGRPYLDKRVRCTRYAASERINSSAPQTITHSMNPRICIMEISFQSKYACVA